MFELKRFNNRRETRILIFADQFNEKVFELIILIEQNKELTLDIVKHSQIC